MTLPIVGNYHTRPGSRKRDWLFHTFQRISFLAEQRKALQLGVRVSIKEDEFTGRRSERC